jgi:ketosteroid isomerase-like protein
VVAVGPSESVYMMTLPKPAGLTEEMFEAGMRLMDEELAALKACIESRPASSAPVRIVETLYEAFRGRNMPAIFDLLAADVEIVQSKDVPWGGVFRGHEGAREFFTRLGSRIRSTLTIERLIDSGEEVTATGWTEGTVNATGAAFRAPVVHVWRTREGKIARAQFLIDHPAMLRALAA